MTSLNDLLEAAKAVEDDKGKKNFSKNSINLAIFENFKKHMASFISRWLVRKKTKKRQRCSQHFLIFFVIILEMISPYKRKRYRRDIERTQG